MRSAIAQVARRSPMASLELWFLADQARFRQERDELEELRSRSEWLTLGAWRLEDEGIVLDFAIDIGHRIYDAKLRFPQTYPHSPAVVRPQDPKARWSYHQFGAGGDLCLRIRPDNWSSELLAWQLVQSAYDLLSGENPASNVYAEVPSAHLVTEGQRLRTSVSRLSLTQPVREQIESLQAGQVLTGRTVFSFQSIALVRSITELQLTAETLWSDPSQPAALRTESLRGHVFVRRFGDDEELPRTATYQEFEEDASKLGWSPESDLLVALQKDSIYAYSALGDSIHSVALVYDQLRTPHSRIGSSEETLSGARVAVIGCGSMGSKVATMLARSGVGEFVLIDDDVFHSENLVRNELDWRDVGHHKVSALSHRIQRVRADAVVSTFQRQLGGQESATSAAAMLLRLADCNLIVDATANAVVGNILSGFMKDTHVPVVWAEVYGGGIGGLVARCRPGVEPSLPLMRRAIENWFAEKGVPTETTSGDYMAELDGVPLIADDSDVTVIAAHATRMAIDLLSRPSCSHYPDSIYVVGMAPCALFSQPFEVHPIALPPPPPTIEKRELTPELTAEENNFLRVLVTNRGGGQ